MSAAQRQRHLKSTTLRANGRVFAEWNLNRVSGGATVRNHLAANQPESDYYSISSVAEVDRPPKGIVKAMTQGTGFAGAGMTSSIVRDMQANSTSYVASMADQYKYYLSPSKSGSAVTGNGGYALTNAGVELTYLSSLPCNSIVIAFETGVSIPRVLSVSYRSGGSWTTVNITNPVLDEDGRLTLWRQDNGTFNSTKHISTNALSIDGVRVQVQESTLPNQFAAIIEVSPRLTVEVTEYVRSVSTDMEVSDSSKVAPLGVSSSNTAGITLDNSDRYFSNDNPTSPFYKMIGRGINFSLYVYPTGVDEVPTDADRVTVFENMVSTRTSKDDSSVTLELKDPSRILQERKPPSILIERSSITEAVIRICHSVGFNDIEYDINDIDPRDKFASIPFFWTDNEKTAWENIAEIAEATQTAVYFDEYGKLQINTRREAFNLSKPLSWTLDGDDVDSNTVTAYFRPADEVGKKSDIASFSLDEEDVPNQVDVNYYETNPGKINRGVPEMVVAWEPEGDVVLRAARVVSDILVGSTTARFNSADVQTWPHNGMFQVNGEVMGYDAKQYSYHLASGSVTTAWVASEEDKKNFDEVNPGRAWANSYNGTVRLTDRGKYFTRSTNHHVGGYSYLVRRKIGTGGLVSLPSNLVKNTSNGYATLSTGSTETNAWVVAKRVMTSGYNRVFGTEITFPTNGPSYTCAGVAIGCGTNDSGVYVELAKTTAVGDRTQFNELNVYLKSTTGAVTRYNGKGNPLSITPGVPYQLDVQVTRTDSAHLMTVYVNGSPRMDFSVPRAHINVLPDENGVFVRGSGSANFGYIYNAGSSTGLLPSSFDSPSQFDLVRGGYRSMIPGVISKWATYMSEATDSWTEPGGLAAKATEYASNFFFDEFGIIAHEVRQFDITYEEKPMMQSKIYLSNSGQAACPGFTYTPFTAHFVLVNTARHHAVVNGEDTMTAGADNSIEQKLFVFGRQVKQDEPKKETSFNKTEAIKEGKVELTIDNQMIQTKDHAAHLASWVAMGGGGGTRQVDVSTFANPHIQLGDLVAIHYEDEDMDSIASRFFVVGKSLQYNGGLKLDLTLRSVV